MISHTNNDIIRTSSTSNNNSGRFIELTVKDANKIADSNCQIQCLGVPGGGGCLQMCVFNFPTALIWELKEEEDDLILAADGAGKLYAKHLSLNFAKEVELIAFDPNKEGYLYADMDEAKTKENAKLQSALEEMQLQLQAASKGAEQVSVVQEVSVVDREMINKLTAENKQLKVKALKPLKVRLHAMTRAEQAPLPQEVSVVGHEMVDKLTAKNK
ncbi:hypothetical protein M0R45_027116 [Rubus argutus]|uniref:Uncharacterized protein n=1 Tax=Rubus argutus TaxID=59490 RepID=A0AAW1X215_RUBAR